MLISANKMPKGRAITADLCIVGSGPAGLSFALEFQDREEKIFVLESGDLALNSEAQTLNDLENDNLPISPNSRMRVFGGTGTSWKGLWKPHHEIDFLPRPWVLNSGWPISRQELEPYYQRAAQRFNAPQATDYASGGWLDSQRLTTSPLFRLADEDLDLATKYQTVLKQSRNITVYLGANVVRLHAEGGGARVAYAEVRTLDGNSFTVTARRYVLACGGIENARLLLHSRVGNENVGRYYQDHPKGVAGVLTTIKPVKWPAYWGVMSGRWWMKAGLRLSDAVQEREQLLNSFITLEPAVGPLGKLGKKYFGLAPATRTVHIRNYLEQAPVRSSRVTLSGKKDRFGNPLAKVSWLLSELDKKTMIVFHRILKDELFKRGIGEFHSPILTGSNQEFPTFTDASHHMGTTRMGGDPRTSVVDTNCKLHGVDNAYVAGSSVFPTGGYANPNATIVALAIRLGDYLKEA